MNTSVHIDNRQFYRTLLAIAVPIALQNLIASSFTMVDNIMVGKMGETALASVGLATQLFSVQWMMIFGLCSGCSTFYSQFWGTSDVKSIRKTLGFAWTACVSLSLIFFLVAQFAPGFVLGLFTNEPIAIEQGKGYLTIAAVNFLFVAICQPVVAALRATQQTKPPLYITIAAFFTNTCLNYCLIFGNFGFPRLEIRGAAIATGISRALETVLTLYC
ncbi:MAG: polysaccharide biosynthesis C-terminal domain-containing protein, partial [Clostridia bacterium]|nr:polysaccharide biosynthesis C-terminal domain-containing protein [Clostridia bacterium]